MNKQQLAAKIWESANKMRSKIEANEYKDYILGFIFYKFLSEKEVKYLKANDWTDEYLPELTEEDTETVESIQKNLGYFISYVEVNVTHRPDGTARPCFIKFENGEKYEIDRVIQKCRAASTKVGGTGIRYTVQICGKPTFLFDEENGKWFVEAKT